MSILKNLSTALNGGVREAAEVVIDANSLRIMGQEIHECEQDVSKSKLQLASIIAEKTQVKRALDTLQENSQNYEEKISQHLKQGDEEKALEVAELMANEEPQLHQKQEHFEKLKSHEMSLQNSLKKTILGLESFKSDYKMAKATDNLQKSQGSNSTSSDPSARFSAMEESMKRINEKQQDFTDKSDAMAQVETALNMDSMKEIKNSKTTSADIIKRLKEKNGV